MESSNNESGAFMYLHCPTITELFKDKAEKELGETKEKRKESLFALRRLIESERNLIACTTDDFLLKFLRAKKFDTERAFDLLKKYYIHRQDYPSLHKSGPHSHNLKLMQENFMIFLPLRTPGGCAVWAVRVGLWVPGSFTIEELISFGFLCHEHSLKNPRTQICGIESIVDFRGLSWSHLFHMSPKSVAGFVRAMQDCFPIRHKAIHIINHPSVFDFLFAIIKPLLSPKIRNRVRNSGETQEHDTSPSPNWRQRFSSLSGYLEMIHFHDDERSLHQFIPPDILPEVFGGTFGTFENKEFMNSLLNSESELEELKKFGYETKKY